MADSVAKKPVNTAGATAGQPKPASPAPAPAAAGAAPASKPAAASSAPSGAPAEAKSAPAAPKPIASVDDLIERAEDRLIPKGSTVRLSPEHPDVPTKARQEELEDSLEACGIKVVWDKAMGKDRIVVDAAAKK